MSGDWNDAEVEYREAQEWDCLYGEDDEEREDDDRDGYFPRPSLTKEEAAADMRKWNTIMGFVMLAGVVVCLLLAVLWGAVLGGLI